MTSSPQPAPQPAQPTDFGARTVVAAGGALILLVLAVIVYVLTGMWIPVLIIVALIPVHLALAITDTNMLEDPKTAPARAWTSLQTLKGGRSATQPTVGSGVWAPPGPAARPEGPTPPANAGPPTSQFPPTTQASPAAPTSPVQPGAAVPPAPGPHHPPAPTPPPAFSGPAPGGPVQLGPGLSYDPPGPHGPSVVHGFGSYGGRPQENSAPAPAHEFAEPSAEPWTDVATEPPSPAPAEWTPAPSQVPAEGTSPSPEEDSSTRSTPEVTPRAMPVPPGSEDDPSQWDHVGGNALDDPEDPDLTVPRPPRG